MQSQRDLVSGNAYMSFLYREINKQVLYCIVLIIFVIFISFSNCSLTKKTEHTREKQIIDGFNLKGKDTRPNPWRITLLTKFHSDVTSGKDDMLSLHIVANEIIPAVTSYVRAIKFL